ncbi:hypothetical protein BRARA_H01872 [Brassica rapa]|uniref:CNNM transmembrane domain-containing protein n=1 Tax=Brassica campestris TaxID=3711 RepID=A0A397YE82_BRACM|nr:hypothetical protein BRARA_H01872 [Brassica rapa]
MHPFNAMMAARMLTAVGKSNGLESETIPFGSLWWSIYAGVSCFLVLFAGIMSGLTLGLMSLSLVDLEILQRSGSPKEKKQSAAILPVVQKQHQLLVTLLLFNALAMEGLPIYLDKIFNEYVAIILSVTFVLFVGEVIPQAICSRYGLAVGANLVWLVRILMILSYPISFPVAKMLDCVLGHGDPLFRRAQLKALVSIHGEAAGKGGELTHDETTIISGALDLTAKTAREAMTPIESIFSLDMNSKLDWEAMDKIQTRGHSRIPVYSDNPKNVVGLLLVKSLLTVRPESDTLVSTVGIRHIPRVPADMPLYDILNEFQKGSSHMAAVVKVNVKRKGSLSTLLEEESTSDSKLTTPLLLKREGNQDNVVVDIDKISNSGFSHTSEEIEDGEVIGVITLEDVFEELLQEEIVDETDEYVDVHKRIRVATVAAVAISSLARAPSSRRLLGQKGTGGPKTPKASSTTPKTGQDKPI